MHYINVWNIQIMNEFCMNSITKLWYAKFVMWMFSQQSYYPTNKLLANY
jgi:hypothetical protein